MKNSKLAKFGIVSLAAVTLGVVAPVVAPVNFGGNVVYAEDVENNRKINFNYYEYGSINQPEGVNGPSTVTVAPGESYSLPNVEVPNHYLYRIDSNLAGVEDVKPGYKIDYNSLPDTYDGADVYYVYKQGTQPETPAEQPQTPPEVPATKPETPAEKPSDKPAEKPTEEPAKPAQPETPANKPAEEPQKPADKPVEPAKPEVPATKPETPAEKPSDKPVQPAKPAEQPTAPEKPTEKPATKPTDTNKPVVKPADNGKPEVKPENKVEPKAEMKPTQQSGNAAANAQTPAPKADTKAPATAAPKADKPTDKKMETLPNTGESDNSIFLALGALLAFVATKLFSFRKKS